MTTPTPAQPTTRELEKILGIVDILTRIVERLRELEDENG